MLFVVEGGEERVIDEEVVEELRGLDIGRINRMDIEVD